MPAHYSFLPYCHPSPLCVRARACVCVSVCVRVCVCMCICMCVFASFWYGCLYSGLEIMQQVEEGAKEWPELWEENHFFGAYK